MHVVLGVGAALCASVGLAHAKVEELRRVNLSTPERVQAQRLTTQAVTALASADYARALTLADQAIATFSEDGWAYYDRAAALAGLGRLEEAQSSYREADRRFAKDGDDYGRSVAMYGEAIALSNAGRCADAQPRFDAYSQFMASHGEPQAAELGRQYARGCVTPAAPVARTPAPPSERQPVRGSETPSHE